MNWEKDLPSVSLQNSYHQLSGVVSELVGESLFLVAIASEFGSHSIPSTQPQLSSSKLELCACSRWGETNVLAHWVL